MWVKKASQGDDEVQNHIEEKKGGKHGAPRLETLTHTFHGKMDSPLENLLLLML